MRDSTKIVRVEIGRMRRSHYGNNARWRTIQQGEAAWTNRYNQYMSKATELESVAETPAALKTIEDFKRGITEDYHSVRSRFFSGQ